MQNIETINGPTVHAPVVQHSRGFHLKYDLVLVLVTIIWGITFLVTKFALHLVGPFTYLGLCYSVATLTLTMLFQKRLRRVTRGELLAGGLIGITLFAGYAFQTVGLQLTSVSKAGFLTGLYVPLVPLCALLFLRQRVRALAWPGVALSLVGLLLLSLNQHFNLAFGRGEWLMLGCALSFALQIVLISKFAPQVDAINLAIIQMAVTALLSFVFIPFMHEPMASPPPQAWLIIFLMGTGDMAFCLFMMNWVQQFISSTRATLIYALEPMWAAFFGVLLAHDTLSLLAWIGCACIFIGMIVGRLEKRADPESEVDSTEA